MRRFRSVCLATVVFSAGAHAQIEVSDHELLRADRPEAWAMHYASATTFMTSFGGGLPPAPGQWELAAELGHIPRLGESRRRVGFDGVKLEDLDKSPVFGRLRATLGLADGWRAELGYTPPLEIDGARPRGLFAAALARHGQAAGNLTWQLRAFGQHGSVRGDITCPRALAGIDDPRRNPFGCRAASKDRVALNHYGVEATLGWDRGHTPWHASVGLVRVEAAVDVDALVFAVRDRSRLVTRAQLPYVALGGEREIDARWRLGVELLYVPLTVRRPGAPTSNDGLASLRIRLAYRGD
jgi:hypothetical protein